MNRLFPTTVLAISLVAGCIDTSGLASRDAAPGDLSIPPDASTPSDESPSIDQSVTTDLLPSAPDFSVPMDLSVRFDSAALDLSGSPTLPPAVRFLSAGGGTT